MGTCILAIYAETKTCFILETDVIFSITPCNDTWIFSASNYVWFLNFILCSTKIERFSLPWQGHTLEIEPTSHHGTLCFFRATNPWACSIFSGSLLVRRSPVLFLTRAQRACTEFMVNEAKTLFDTVCVLTVFLSLVRMRVYFQHNQYLYDHLFERRHC